MNKTTIRTMVNPLQRLAVHLLSALVLAFACHPSMAQGPSKQSLAMAQSVERIANTMRAQGRLDSKVSIRAGNLERSNGAALYDARSARCLLEVTAHPTGAKNAPNSPAKSPLWMTYMVYHEMSHCTLFDRPEGLFSHLLEEGVSLAGVRMAEDLILMGTLEPREDTTDGRPLSVLTLTHEIYADVRAMLLMIQDGHSIKDLGFIYRMRHDNPMDLLHDSGAALAVVMSMDTKAIKSMPLADIDRLSKRLAVGQALSKTFAKNGAMSHGDATFLGVNLKYQIQEWHAMARTKDIRFTEFLVGAKLSRPRELAQYGALHWLATQGRSIASSSTPEAFFEAWVTSRYGIDPKRFDAVSKLAAAPIEKLVMGIQKEETVVVGLK